MCDTDSVILCSYLHPYFFVLSSEKKLEEERERERKEQEERGTVFYPHINKVYSFLLCSQLKLCCTEHDSAVGTRTQQPDILNNNTI